MSFFDNIKPSAIKTWQTHQILASIAGGQADLETGTGTSLLSKAPNNNLFGIKASADWTGRTVVMSTSEWNGTRNITVNATFRAYDSPLDSFYDYARFFTSTPWRVENYKHVVGERDYKKASQALQASGYATDPLYAQKLIGRIEKNNLQAWDTEALSGQAVKPVTQNDVLRPITKTVGGPMTDASRANVAKIATTFIGDSLGVGTKPYAQTLITNSNYDVVGSRQLTHATNSLNATHSLQTMKSAGTLKEYIVVIIGTNRGVTASEIDAFVSIAGSGHKILFVDTASQVNHRTSVTSEYRQASMRHANVFHVNWAEYAENMMASYYSKDGANGEYIHMTGAGYKQHAEYIAHALYEASTADFTQTSASDVAHEGTSIKDIELQTDGTVSFKGNRVQEDGSTVYVEETTNIGVKGLYSPLGDENIYYPEANQRWGFDDSVNNSLWIEGRYESETTDPVTLLTEGIKELVDRSDPPSQYTISLLDIDPSISIGDTGIFVDHDFNPPLYIQARILNITTSKTNRSLNKVLLGNVTELFPEDKADLLAIQADLRKTTEGIKRDMIDNEPLMMTVTSSNGNVLGDAYQETQISAKLRKGVKDITGEVARVTWERVSNDVPGDVEVNAVLATQTSSTIVIRTADIANNNSKFVVRFYNGANELMETGEIMVKKADTALWTDRDTAPDDARDGAKWVTPDGKQQIKVDGIWEDLVDQSTILAVKGDVENALTEAEQAKADAIASREEAIAEAERLVAEQNTAWQVKMAEYDTQVDGITGDIAQAEQKAIEALAQAGISTDLATDAKTTADQATINANTAKATADTAKTNADTAKASALEASQVANQAIADALKATTDSTTALDEVTLLTPQVTSAVSNASSALSKANNALTDSQTAIGKANALETTTGTLTTNYNNLTGTVSLKADKTTVDTLSGTVNSQGLNITANAGAIAMKADLTTVSAIKGTVDTHTTQIDANATAITSKASTSTVNALTGRVSTAETSITQQADLIESKASQTEVDTVKGTVSSHTTTLAQQATQISARLTSAQVDTLVTNKGYSTVNYVDNQITASASGIRADMSVVEGKIDNLQVGGTNLVPNSRLIEHPLGLNSHVLISGGLPEGTYTISFDYEIDSIAVGLDNFLIYAGSSVTHVPLKQTGDKRVKQTFIIKPTHANINLTIYFGSGASQSINNAGRLIELQIEKGNIATDWSPSPSDLLMQNDFNTFKASYEATAESLTSRLTAIDKTGGRLATAESNISQNATALTQRFTKTEVNNLLSNKANTSDLTGLATQTWTNNQITTSATGTMQEITRVENKIPSLTGYATQTWTNNQISTTANSITSTISQVESKIDGLQVGGTNLFTARGWEVYTGYGIFVTSDGTKRLVFDENPASASSTVALRNIGLTTPIGIHTLSGYVKIDGEIPATDYLLNITNRTDVNTVVRSYNPTTGYFTITQILSAYSWNLHASASGKGNTSRRIEFTNLKLEKGNVATDYSPAPEDMATVTALTQATQDLSGFKTLVQNTYGTKTEVSAVTQTANNLVTELTRVENKIPSLSGYATQAWSTTQINTKAGEITTSLTTEINKKATPAQITSAILADNKIIDTRNDNQTPMWYRDNYPQQSVREFKSSNALGLTTVQTGGSFGVLTTEVTWTGSTGGKVKQTLVGDSATFERRGNSTHTDWDSWQELANTTYVNTTVTQKAGEVTQLISEVKTSPTTTITGYNSLTNNVNSMVQAIGTDGGKIAQMVMTNSLFQSKIISNLVENLVDSDVVTPNWVADNIIIGTMNSSGTLITKSGTLASRIYSNTYSLVDGRDYYISFEAHHETGNGEIEVGSYSDTNRPKMAVGPANGNRNHVVKYTSVGDGRFSVYFTKSGTYRIGKVVVSTNPMAINTASQVSQLSNSWSLTLKSGDDVKTSINATTNSIRLKADLIHLSGTSLIDNAVIKSAHIETLNANKIVGNTADFNTIRTGVLTADVIKSTHIFADNAFIDRLFATSALIERLTSKSAFINNIKAIEISADKIVGNTAQFIQTAWASLNSHVTIDGGKIKLTNTAGDFVEMNNIPEFRSQDTAGTATIMGKGRTHYYGINNAVATARFYIGTSLEGTGTHGVHIAKGQTFGIYRMSDTYGGTPAQYHVVKAGESWRSVTDMYYTASTSVYIIGNLNGRDPATSYLQIGETIIVKPAVAGNQSGVERLWTMGTATSGATRLYSHPEHIFENRIEVHLRARFLIPALFEQGFTNNSDRRIKHDIQPSKVTALEHIASLSFKEYRLNSSGKHVPIGIIAQDSGILRVKGEDAGDMEGVDGYLMPMLALKGVQELQAIVKQQAETIKQLEELINEELRNCQCE